MPTNKRILALVLMSFVRVLMAQEATPSASVTLDDEFVFAVRAGYGAWTPKCAPA